MGERLSWTEQSVADEFAGAALSLASLCAHLPDRAERLRLAAVGKLDGQGRALVVALAAQITEGGSDVAAATELPGAHPVVRRGRARER